MDKKYISVDIESSGLTPGKYSMLSLGACVVGKTNINFYRELKPLNDNYILEAMKIGCLELECLEKLKVYDEEVDAKNKNFNPLKVLKILEKSGEEPKKVMADFANWIRENTKDSKAVETAGPIKFDGMFTAWYFDNFNDGQNPFEYSGEDINSFFRGVKRNPYAHIEDMNLREQKHKHHALHDAIYQAELFEKVLKMIKISPKTEK
ncbi:3'-5' exoribonuclease [Candidatus Pacearchaeota archaeon]|nr:3'-5' exoribonuclease [Candidatus Pacearchaeota archaeon]